MKFLHELLTRVLAGDCADVLLSGLTPQEKGHTGEALLRILTLLGIHPTDPSAFVIPYKVIPTSRRLEAISTSEITHLLTHGLLNAGGSNKIDACWQTTDASFAVCSSKIGKLHIKSIADLEIGAMLTEFTESGGYTEQGKPVLRESVLPYVLVDNKDEVRRLAKTSRASNRVSKDNLNPLDITDLNRMCAVLRGRLERSPSKEIPALVSYITGIEKPTLRTRFHQKLLCAKILRLLRTGAKTFLIGALPRSGKTWMAADLVKASALRRTPFAQGEPRQFRKVLVITTRPSETRSQWAEVFETHNDFDAYTLYDLQSSAADKAVEAAILRNEQLVAIVSKQYLDHTRDALIDLEWDLVVVDEAHAGGSTERSAEALDVYAGGEAVRIFLTATYTKPQEFYSIPEECCCFWDLEDIRLMRQWGESAILQRLLEKFGKSDVSLARRDCFRAGDTNDSIRACYTTAPQLSILTTLMQPTLYEALRIATNSSDTVYGFSMKALFTTTKDGKAFQNPAAVDMFLALLTGSNKMKNYPKGDMSMFARIRRYWKTMAHREGDDFMTQLWFLPYGTGQLLNDVKQCLLERIRANPVLAQFATFTMDGGCDLRTEIAAAVVDARAAGKRGLLLLTGNVGSLGISLPSVDVAFMLHDFESADMNYQQMMRVLTEAAGKRCGLVVDFNVWRVLTTLNTYATARCGQADTASAERISWCISHLVDVDPDLWQCAESPETVPQARIAEELTAQWRRMLEQSGKSVARLARTPVDLGADQATLDSIAKHQGGGSSAVAESLRTNDQEPLESGVERRSDAGSVVSAVEKKEKKETLNELLARLIPEIALLSGCERDLLTALRRIQSDPIQKAAMNEFLHAMNQKQK